MPHELAIVGAGVMAEAISRGIISGNRLKPEQIIAADVSPERRKVFHEQLKIEAIEDAAKAVTGAKMVLLAVKPYQMETVLGGISSAVMEGAIVISIAAGISSAFIEQHLGESKKPRVIRSMPNTPMLVGQGMVAIAPGKYAGESDLAQARRIFESGAKVLTTTEDKIDPVTAVSGSGPAYFFFLTEQMIRAGVEMGLSAEEARTLAIQTALGAAKMMSESPDSPADHRKRVTTPNGTTHAAISHMETHGWPQITVDALKVAAKRSGELGK